MKRVYRLMLSLVLLLVCLQASPQEAVTLTATATRAGSLYHESSVLATGRWAKIRVPATGIYELTSAVIRQAGFSSLDKVKIYGYGGAMQPEKLTSDYLRQTDDLAEVPTCTVGGRRLFYATGPVSWSRNWTKSTICWTSLYIPWESESL